MGQVYRAQDTRLKRDVAIKVLPSDVNSVQALERFEREARAIAALNHPNICTVYDVGAAGPHHFLVMELLDGETLHQRLTRGPLDPASVIETGIALADALVAAHARGLIHRDLKPANIVLTTRGPKILDFGLAKVVDAGRDVSPAGGLVSQAVTLSAPSPLTDPGVTVGTIAYMSPEQLRGESLDARTDLFSLGLVLYEAVTGRRAFSGATNAVVSASILHDAPTAPRRLRADVPPRLEQAILTTLEKDRDIRTQTASELRAELTRITREMGSLRPAPDASSGSLAAPAASAAVSAAPSPASSSDAQIVAGLVRRHRGGILGIAALLALGVLGGIYAVRRGATPNGSRIGPAPLTIADLQVEQLTSSGTASSPAISPDGKYVAYVEQGTGGDSLRVRQVTSGSNVEVVPAESGVRLRGATVTPDGGFVDYLKFLAPERLELWRIPFLGGVPQRRLDNIASLVGWSPDGRQMAYLRDAPGGRTELMVAVEGSADRVLATRMPPERFWTTLPDLPAAFVPAWSPDGRTLAVLGAMVRPGGSTGQVVFVDVASGSTRAVNAGPPLLGSALGWRDATTVVIAMLVQVSSPLQLWQMSFPEGTVRHLTNDLNQYAGVSFTSDRNTLVTGRSEFSLGIWTSDAAATQWTETVPVKPIRGPVGFGVVWAGEDLIFLGGTGTNFALLRRRQSTGETETLAPAGGSPSITRDGSTVVFFDYNRGRPYKMDADGRSRVELGRVLVIPSVTPDGRYLVANNPTGDILFAPVDGKGASRDAVKGPTRPGGLDISQDGRWIAYQGFDDRNRPATIVCDVATCMSRRILPPLTRPRFTTDGKAIGYLGAQGTNIWLQPVDGGPPRQLTHFAEDGRTIWDFAWSANGKRLAVGRALTTNNIVMFQGLNRKH
jgi:Tol biopolymer transport system component